MKKCNTYNNGFGNNQAEYPKSMERSMPLPTDSNRFDFFGN